MTADGHSRSMLDVYIYEKIAKSLFQCIFQIGTLVGLEMTGQQNIFISYVNG
jgi:hypothetical protein